MPLIAGGIGWGGPSGLGLFHRFLIKTMTGPKVFGVVANLVALSGRCCGMIVLSVLLVYSAFWLPSCPFSCSCSCFLVLLLLISLRLWRETLRTPMCKNAWWLPQSVREKSGYSRPNPGQGSWGIKQGNRNREIEERIEGYKGSNTPCFCQLSKQFAFLSLYQRNSLLPRKHAMQSFIDFLQPELRAETKVFICGSFNSRRMIKATKSLAS